MSQTGSLLSAVYQPKPAAGPRPFASYIGATWRSVPYEMPAVCVRRSRMVIGRRAGTISGAVPGAAASFLIATFEFAKLGM